MKYIIILLVTFASISTVSAQVYSSTEIQSVQDRKDFSFKPNTLKETGIINSFLSWSGKKGVGVWTGPYIYSEGIDIPLGILFEKDDTVRNIFREAGIAPGVSFYQQEKLFYAEGYAYLETKSDQPRAAGKIVLQVNPAYTPAYKEGWINTSFIVSATKWLALGLRYQSDGAQGGVIQFAPSSHVSIWGAGYKRCAVGLTITFGQ